MSSPMGDDAMDPDGGMPSDGAMPSELDPADCIAFAQSMASAAQTCGTPLPGGAQATWEQWCRKGVRTAEMCGGDPAGGLDCFATPNSDDWVCLAGEPYPACGGDLGSALGAYCLIALGNPQCATGIACNFNSDCSNGLTCNGATKQCMSESAYCVGLPCEFNSDCPQGHTCNDAEGACIME